MAIIFDATTRSFFLNTQTASYVMHVTEDGALVNLHWGARIATCDLRGLLACYREGASFDAAAGRLPYETPTRQGCYYGTAAVGVIQAAGDTVTELKYVSHRIVPGKPALTGLPATYVEDENEAEMKKNLLAVYEALNEKGYNSISQIVGYILSEDPTYITTHNNARSLVRRLDRDELLQAMVKCYLGIK